jgi:hypothetical protein
MDYKIHFTIFLPRKKTKGTVVAQILSYNHYQPMILHKTWPIQWHANQYTNLMTMFYFGEYKREGIAFCGQTKHKLRAE